MMRTKIINFIGGGIIGICVMVLCLLAVHWGMQS